MATEQAVLVFKVDTKDIGRAQKELEGMGFSAIKTKSKIKELEKGAGKGGKGVGQFGRKAGMAGIQFEQLAGQIAMGQNPMRAVGVQAADLGFVLGTPLLGAVVGISAAMASVLIPTLLNLSLNTEKLTELNEKLAESFVINTDGSVELSKKMQDLIKKFGTAGELALELSRVDALKGQKDAAKALIKEYDKLIPSQFKLSQQMLEYQKIGKTSMTVDNAREDVLAKTAKAYGISVQQLKPLVAVMQDFKDGNQAAASQAEAMITQLLKLEGVDTAKKFKNISEVLSTAGINFASFNMLAEENAEVTDEAAKKAGELIEKLQERYDLEIGKITELDILLKDYNVEQAKQIINLKDLLKAEKERQATEKQTAAAQIAANKRFDARLLKLQIEGELLDGNADAAIELDKTLTPLQKKQLQAQIDKNNELRETIRLREQQADSDAAILANADKLVEAYKKARADQAAADKKAAEEKEARVKSEMQKTKDAETLAAERYLANLDFLATLDGKYAEQKKVLGQKYLDDYNAAVAQAQAQEAALKQEQIVEETAANIERLSVNEEYWALWLANAQNAMTTFNDITAAGVNTFQSGFGSAFEQIIMDGEGIKGVVSGIFEDMARAQIAALGQMAAERLTLFLMDKALGKSAAASGAAAMIANATAAQAMAGIQAYASAAAVPLTGYLAAPAALTAALTATAPLLATVATASGNALGARALGGQVRGGQSYLVGERGPEILNMPNNSMGKITPNNMLGGGRLNVTVENYGSSNISVQKISETDVRIIAREVASQTVQREAPRVIATDIANPNGRVSKTLANNTSTQRRR